MSNQELNTLSDLLLKLQNERLQEYRDEGYDVDGMDDEEIMELVDTVFCIIQNIRGD